VTYVLGMAVNCESLPFLPTPTNSSEALIMSNGRNLSNSNEKSYPKYKSHQVWKVYEILCYEILTLPILVGLTPDWFLLI